MFYITALNTHDTLTTCDALTFSLCSNSFPFEKSSGCSLILCFHAPTNESQWTVLKHCIRGWFFSEHLRENCFEWYYTWINRYPWILVPEVPLPSLQLPAIHNATARERDALLEQLNARQLHTERRTSHRAGKQPWAAPGRSGQSTQERAEVKLESVRSQSWAENQSEAVPWWAGGKCYTVGVNVPVAEKKWNEKYGMNWTSEETKQGQWDGSKF